jgi:hypothetical protein
MTAATYGKMVMLYQTPDLDKVAVGEVVSFTIPDYVEKFLEYLRVDKKTYLSAVVTKGHPCTVQGVRLQDGSDAPDDIVLFAYLRRDGLNRYFFTYYADDVPPDPAPPTA